MTSISSLYCSVAGLISEILAQDKGLMRFIDVPLQIVALSVPLIYASSMVLYH